MENLVWLVPVIACPLMMVAMMWMMGKGMGLGGKRDKPERSAEELRAERRRLDEEIEALEERGEGPEEGGDGTAVREFAHTPH